MTVPPEVLGKLAQSVQPLVFETGINELPYSIAGTVFLVGYEGHPYILTTRHSLNPENLGPICVFPSDTSHRIFPLKDVFFVPRNEESEDFVDLAVISIDTTRITHAEVAHATLIDIALASGDWESSSADAKLFILGYPEDRSFVDYETETLHTDRQTLNARYIGPTKLPYFHEIEILGQHSLSTFSGFSGSPVFAWIQQPGKRPQVVFCGMAVRGSTQSGRMRFLDRSVLIDALKVKNTFNERMHTDE